MAERKEVICKCVDAKNKWFSRIVMGWDEVTIEDVEKAFNSAFGKQEFKKAYSITQGVNRKYKGHCHYCGTNYHIRTV